MNKPSEIDMRAFLLGRLSDQATAEAEERLIGDDLFFEQLVDVEDELIDDLVSVNLPPEDRGAFLRSSLHQPGMEERIRIRRTFIEVLQGKTERELRPAEKELAVWRARWMRHFLIPGLSLATAAALLALALLYRSHKPAAQLATTPKGSAAPTSHSPAPVRPVTPKALSAAVLFFPQHVSRGATQNVPLRLSAGGRSEVRFELEVPMQSSASSNQWTMTIANARRIAVKQSGLHLRQLEGIDFVSCRFNPASLAPGSYTVSLFPMNAPSIVTTWDLTVTE